MTDRTTIYIGPLATLFYKESVRYNILSTWGWCTVAVCRGVMVVIVVVIVVAVSQIICDIWRAVCMAMGVAVSIRIPYVKFVLLWRREAGC